MNGAKGDKGDKGDNGSQGSPGVSVTDAIIMDNELVFSFSDGTTDNVGNVVGSRGSQGEKGDKGEKGDRGSKGDPGDTYILTFGTVATNGSFIYRGPGNWSSVFTTAYEITAFKDGKQVTLETNNCSVQVTPVGNGITSNVSFKSGNLIVSLFDSDNKPVQSPFFFTLYQF